MADDETTKKISLGILAGNLHMYPTRDEFVSNDRTQMQAFGVRFPGGQPSLPMKSQPIMPNYRSTMPVEDELEHRLRRLIPVEVRAALHELVQQNNRSDDKMDRYGARMFAEGYEMLTITYANKRLAAAFMPEPDITVYEMHLCRKALDGAVYGSILAYLLHYRLMRHFGQIDIVNADGTTPTRLRRSGNRFHYVPAEGATDGTGNDGSIRTGDTGEGHEEGDQQSVEVV